MESERQDQAGKRVHVPQMPAERVEQIRRWHARAYREARAALQQEQTFAYLGRTIVVPPQVMPITPVSHLLGEAVLAEVGAQDRVLDMGTGSGVNAVLAAASGADVLAVDINPHALAAARSNAVRNGVAARVTVRHSDVFEFVDGVFDVMVFDPPFRWFAPRDLLEAATTDENYGAMTRFFNQARDYLKPGGRLLVFFGSSGDLEYLHRLIEASGFHRTVLARHAIVKDGQQVDYVALRLAVAGHVAS
ncbi:methyltransferase [Actinoalloteichus hymeniacidonis]|nr:methyltransferase [Actinoalloteichus hymeniacidonis]MBB5907271.1 release factor glutamine methyltransferase [Actinoalloteichus hymeniacidonis]